ncbi:MAG: agmatine deiminase family protein [Muribaculaceae bacterium]|nr:agmatine deiminase family protein [Muribaculaceae bacterium]
MAQTVSPYRLPAEWESQEAILIAFPHERTDWAYMLEDARNCFVNIISAIVNEAGLTAVVVTPEPDEVRKRLSRLDSSRIIIAECPTDDTWARDFGPISLLGTDTASPLLLDFKFNGWGLKFRSCNDNLINMRLSASGLLKADRRNHLGFVLEGGSIESDGCGTILTTSECLLSPNRNGNLSRSQIEKYLLKAFGARKILWLDHGFLQGDDTDSHIDTLARLAPRNTIYYVKCDDPADPHFKALEAMEHQLSTFTDADGSPYNLIGLPLPDPIYDPDDGSRLPATYANFLITPHAILLPVYGQPRKDKLAEMMMKIAFPDHDIVTIDCRALIRQHGSLHCVTMQLLPNTLF